MEIVKNILPLFEIKGKAAPRKINPVSYAICEARKKFNVTDTQGRDSWGGWWRMLNKIPWDIILQCCERSKIEGRYQKKLFFYLINKYKYGKSKRKS